MLKIFDNHIPEELRVELVHDKEYLERPMEYYTFWEFKHFNNPTTKMEEALHHIWKDLVDPKDYPDGGIEYWINKSNGMSKGIWHLDLVEAEQAMKYHPAVMSVAYYPYIDCVGGFLEICDNENRPSKQEFKDYLRGLDPQTQVERIKPITNRAVFYNADRIHRVAKTYKGVREVLASSVWKKKPLTFNDKASYNI